MKLSGTTEKLKNSELLLLHLAVHHYIKRGGMDLSDFKAFNNLNHKLKLLVDGNTHTHYQIKINGTNDRILTKEDIAFDEMLESFSSDNRYKLS